MDVACVDIDNVAAAHLAVSHLFGLGHRRIGMIVHAPLAYTAAAARLEGYQQVLLEQALPFDEQLVAMADYTPLSGERAMDQLLALEDPPSAVFVSSDTVAVGAVHSAKRAGLRIPDDLALVGFDDIPMAVYQAPPLTTVRLPAYGLGWAAADLLVRLIGQERVNERTVLLEAELIVRASCGAN
jgi:LacI family transcriptional regulator